MTSPYQTKRIMIVIYPTVPFEALTIDITPETTVADVMACHPALRGRRLARPSGDYYDPSTNLFSVVREGQRLLAVAGDGAATISDVETSASVGIPEFDELEEC